jgi:hypothetical protein
MRLFPGGVSVRENIEAAAMRKKSWKKRQYFLAACMCGCVVCGVCACAAPEGQAEEQGRLSAAVGSNGGPQNGMTETVALQLNNPHDGSKFYNNPVYDAAGRQVGMHNYTLDTEGNILDDSYQRWNGKITGEGVYVNYRSDKYRNGTKIIVGKDGKSTTFWWDRAAKDYTDKNPTGGKYSAMRFDKAAAREQRDFDVRSGIIDLRTVYGVDAAKRRE